MPSRATSTTKRSAGAIAPQAAGGLAFVELIYHVATTGSNQDVSDLGLILTGTAITGSFLAAGLAVLAACRALCRRIVIH